MIQAAYRKGDEVKIFWKGTLLNPKDQLVGRTKNKGALYLLDKIAQTVVQEFKVPYVNSTDVLQYIPRYHEENGFQLYTKDR
jgi:hypothetical protein